MVRVVLPLKLTPESETHFHWFLKPCKTLENPWLSLHSGQNPPTNSVEEAIIESILVAEMPGELFVGDPAQPFALPGQVGNRFHVRIAVNRMGTPPDAVIEVAGTVPQPFADFLPLQQNSWVSFGSGSSPSV